MYDDPDRLRRPVKRVGSGDDPRWEEIGWDEALDLAADGLAAAINEHGRDALAIYLGNPNVHSLGSMTHGTAMVTSFRTRNTLLSDLGRPAPAQLWRYLLYGHQLLVPIPDIDRTSYFLVLGGNPMASQRLADDGARLPRADARAEGPRRTDGRARPAAHRDRQGRRRAPLRAARHRRRGC